MSHLVCKIKLETFNENKEKIISNVLDLEPFGLQDQTGDIQSKQKDNFKSKILQ